MNEKLINLIVDKMRVIDLRLQKPIMVGDIVYDWCYKEEVTSIDNCQLSEFTVYAVGVSDNKIRTIKKPLFYVIQNCIRTPNGKIYAKPYRLKL